MPDEVLSEGQRLRLGLLPVYKVVKSYPLPVRSDSSSDRGICIFSLFSWSFDDVKGEKELQYRLC